MLPPLRNTHMTTATYYACIVYVRRYAAARGGRTRFSGYVTITRILRVYVRRYICVECKLPRWTTRRPNFSGQFMAQQRR